jgi:hypothetical protein
MMYSFNRVRFKRLILSLVLPILLGGSGCLGALQIVADSFSSKDLEFFERNIRPVLAQSCYECHSHQSKKLKGGLLLDSRASIMRGGESGAVIDSSIVENSPLLIAIHYQNVDLQMPPQSRLTESQIKNITRWVNLGLPWPDEPEPTPNRSQKSDFDIEKRKAGHWVWKAPAKQALPEVNQSDWVEEPIDAFLLHRLEKEGMSPAPTVGKRTLLRRIYLILTGLPPSPQQVDAFIEDDHPKAYEKVVDQLLGSVHYGEQWARHWLDLVRYAETMGHEFDYVIPNAWKYRDYVIRAFNEDIPFDSFAKEHIAGDLLKVARLRKDNGENESILGTGFYWLGQQVHSPVDIRMNQLDVLDNQIDVLTKSFQALTVTCARCHDHKFDAISTKDFYSIYGVVKSSRYQQSTLRPLDRIESTVKTLEGLQNEVLNQFASNFSDVSQASSEFKELIKNADVTLLGDASIDGFEDWLFSDEAMSFDPFVKPGTMVSRPGETSVVLASREAIDSAKWSVALQGALRSRTFTISHRYLHVYASGKDSRVNVVVDNFNLIRAPIYGGLKKNLNHEEAKWITFDLGMWEGHEAYVELKDTQHSDLSGGGAHGPNGWFSVETVLSSGNAQPPTLKRPLLRLSQEDLSDVLVSKMDSYAQTSDSIPLAPVAISMTDGNGVNESVFIRGNPKNLGEEAPRGFIEALSHIGNRSIEGSGRLALAEHIASPDNPLTARVYVNRIWHHIFGIGLVPTVDDFGVLGQRPTHPELLDWLAVWFVNEGEWSTKKLIRMLVLSSAFQMDSKSSPEMDAKDEANNLLHKMRVRRLEGESIRDSLLKVSGQLDPKSYGPSEKIHLTSFMTGRGRPRESGPLDGANRRSIYVEVRRNFLSPFLITFDTPIPFTTFGKRSQSNVPAQSLVLMNDPFVIQQAEAWATKLQGLNISNEAKLIHVYETALGRLPAEDETRSARQFLKEQKRVHLKNVNGPEEAGKKAWADLCHVLFNVKEFIYIH